MRPALRVRYSWPAWRLTHAPFPRPSEQFEVSKYYGIRSTDLVYFLLFSAFLVPALWVIDIFLFNLQVSACIADASS